jgi:adenylylsulfate kinase-like enzyme
MVTMFAMVSTRISALLENIRRAGVVAKLMVEGGLIVLCSFISPNRADREMVRGLFDDGEFIVVFVVHRLKITCGETRKDFARRPRQAS